MEDVSINVPGYGEGEVKGDITFGDNWYFYVNAREVSVNLGKGLITPPVAPLLYMVRVVGGSLPLKEHIWSVMYCMIFRFMPMILHHLYTRTVCS